MFDTKIKICGITSLADARLCLQEGADYLGLIFASSPRAVTLETAEAIRRAEPGAMLVGVFADARIEDIVRASERAGLNLLQLHGSEEPDYCERLLKRVSLPIIKCFSSIEGTDVDRLPCYRRTSYFMFDLDKKRNGHPVTELQDGLWQEAAQIRRKGYRIFLGGGLNPDNVRTAIRQVSPYCIDVASGVETSPGVKNPRAVEAFVRSVRS